MKTIAAEDIEALMCQMDQASTDQAQQVAARMQSQQPYIMVYLLAAEEQADEGAEPGWLLWLGGVICEAAARAHPRLRQVAGDDLLAAEEKNVQMLEKLEDGSEMDFVAAVERLLSTYNQQPLLGAVLAALMAGHEEAPELAPDNIGVALLHLKTVIDCLDQ